MTRLLLFIKHRLPFIWRLVDWLNTMLFRLLYGDRLLQKSTLCCKEFTLHGYKFRLLEQNDIAGLFELLDRQSVGRLEYFKPHGFDFKSLSQVLKNRAVLMFGVFSNNGLVGYFFLRCFWNRRSFVGRLIDESHEGKGIGRVMNSILYNTAWRSNFRCHTTISKSNTMVMRSHERNPNVRILSELPNDYLFVEFVQTDTRNAD